MAAQETAKQTVDAVAGATVVMTWLDYIALKGFGGSFPLAARKIMSSP